MPFPLSRYPSQVRGSDARTVFMATGVSVESLKKIWSLADISKRGLLDAEEFAVAMFLIESLRDGKLTELPARLPESYVPPAKRHLVLSALHQ